MMSRRFRVVRGGLVALSVVAVLAAALALAGAERQWPTFPTYAFNLDYGPAFAGGSLEQTFAAPATPLRSIEVRAVSSWPDAVIVRLRDVGNPAAPLLVESGIQVAGDGVIRLEPPGTVDTSGRLLQVQVINPPESLIPLVLQANRINPYAGGQATLGGDAGAGTVDLVMQTWRRVTPTALAVEVLRAHALGTLFAVATAIVAACLALAWVRGRLALRSRSVVAAAALLVIAAGLALARVGFEALAPWLA